MSQSDTQFDDENVETEEEQQTQTRHPAVRVFASEFNNAAYNFKTEASDRAPKYTLLPTGERVNRVLVVGVLTEKQEIETDNGDFIIATVHDGSDSFKVTASRYQPDEANALRGMETPQLISVVGKVSHWEQEDDVVVELKPESISAVEQQDRFQWVLETFEATRDRVDAYNQYTGDDDSATIPKDIELSLENYPDHDVQQYVDVGETIMRKVILKE